MLSLALATFSALSPQASAHPVQSRFELSAALPAIPAVTLDTFMGGGSIASELARSRGLQGRVMWIDGTANIVRVNTEEKIVSLVAKIKESGFNTIVYDVKPISGQTLYPSAIAPKIEEWKGQKLPLAFDPLRYMVREAHKNGLSLLLSLNAFSEGHNLFRVGPGYAKPDWQTVIYDTTPMAIVGGQRFSVGPKANTGPEPGQLGLYNADSKVPALRDGDFAVTVGADGKIFDGFKGVAESVPAPPLPKGGWALVAGPDTAPRLMACVNPGARVRLDAEATFRPISERPELQYPLMMNPNNTEVREYELSILREIASNYEIDGVLYDDRLRYAGVYADFSPITRNAFERYVGKKLTWPDDVFKFTYTSGLQRGMDPGPYFDAWMAWRPLVLKQFAAEAKAALTKLRPNAIFGIYAGSWYGEYPALGSNYASPDFKAGFWFLTPEYRRSGMADLLDLMISGCYYTTATIQEAMTKAQPIGSTVEAAADLTKQAVRDRSWCYAGISLDQFNGNPEGLARALQAACGSAQGVMVFDLSHNIEPMWPVFKQAFSQPMRAPHTASQTLADVRRLRKIYDDQGLKGKTPIITAGSSGVGQ